MHLWNTLQGQQGGGLRVRLWPGTEEPRDHDRTAFEHMEGFRVEDGLD